MKGGEKGEGKGLLEKKEAEVGFLDVVVVVVVIVVLVVGRVECILGGRWMWSLSWVRRGISSKTGKMYRVSYSCFVLVGNRKRNKNSKIILCRLFAFFFFFVRLTTFFHIFFYIFLFRLIRFLDINRKKLSK